MKKKILALTLALTIPAASLAAFANSEEAVNYDDLVVTLPATEADAKPVYTGDESEFITILPAKEGDAIPVVDNEYGVVPISLTGEERPVAYADFESGKKIVFGADAKELKGIPAIQNDILMLPLREIAEADGITVEWDEETNTAKLNSGMFAVTLGENKYIKGRMKALELDCAPVLIDDKTYVPAKFFEEVLDKKVEVKENEIVITDAVIGESDGENTAADEKADESTTEEKSDENAAADEKSETAEKTETEK